MSGLRLTARGRAVTAALVALLLLIAPGVASVISTELTGVDDLGQPIHSTKGTP